MGTGSYRELLALPGVRPLLVLATLARIPSTALAVTMTLYVVTGLGKGYTEAGAVATAFTVGAAAGGPLLGRLVDRRGVRTMLALAMTVEAGYFSVLTFLSYPAVLATSVLAGALAVPLSSLTRQALAAAVPERLRRSGYSMDSMLIEISYMTGPTLAVLLATTASPRWAILAVGAGILAGAASLFVLNPATRSDTERAEESVSGLGWLGPQLWAVLVASAGALLVLAGSEIAIVAVLRASGETSFTGPVLISWGVASLLGGYAYGAARRSVSSGALLALLGVLTIPVAWADNWWVLFLLIIPAGALCAPTIAATSDAISRQAPASVRGVAMGMHNSALTVGGAVGAPLAGALIDALGPGVGFAGVGLAGLLLGGVVMLLQRMRGSPGVDVGGHQPRAATSSAIS